MAEEPCIAGWLFCTRPPTPQAFTGDAMAGTNSDKHSLNASN
jgi:hypothetical protein